MIIVLIIVIILMMMMMEVMKVIRVRYHACYQNISVVAIIIHNTVITIIIHNTVITIGRLCLHVCLTIAEFRNALNVVKDDLIARLDETMR